MGLEDLEHFVNPLGLEDLADLVDLEDFPDQLDVADSQDLEDQQDQLYQDQPAGQKMLIGSDY